MASPEILYRGGELESLRVLSGMAEVGTDSSNYDPAYSVCGVNIIEPRVYGGDFSSSVSGGDDLWAMVYHALSNNTRGPILTVLDDTARPAIRLARVDSGMYSLEHNTSPNTSPSWTSLTTFSRIGGYFVFRVKTGASKDYSVYNQGDVVASGTFTNSLFSALSRFTIGSTSAEFGLASSFASQIQFSRGISLVNSRVWTRKANAAGTYQQMTGVFGDLVKTSINDGQGLTSNTSGQITTNGYQDVTIPDGLSMHPDVWVWSRVRNDGSEPSKIKAATVVSGVLQIGAELPVDAGFLGLPYIINGMTPTLWNSCEVGMESADS